MSIDFKSKDGIIACSSGRTYSAISLIRISSEYPISYFDCFKFKSEKLESRKSFLVDIVFDNKIFDEALLVFFEVPNSYTGENVVEIAVHGNPVNVDRIIAKFTEKYSLRVAEPGEFTYRALKNKKTTVTQVEGLDVLLNAKSSMVFESGLNILKGSLNKDFVELKESFVNLKTSLEFNIDFAEDIGEEESLSIFKANLASFTELIGRLKSRVESSTDLISPRISLFGKTNAGKSTLFNQILGKKRAITSVEEGTTRDFISEEIKIDSNAFTLVDTAGIRETLNPVESEGILRSKELLNDSFFKVLVVNHSDNSDLDDFREVDFDLLVFTHYEYESGPMGAVDIDFKHGPIGANLLEEDISNKIKCLASEKFSSLFDENPILVPRYKEYILKCCKVTLELNDMVKNSYDIGIIDNYLIQISKYVNDLVGQFTAEDTLNTIFGNFCIGK